MSDKEFKSGVVAYPTDVVVRKEDLHKFFKYDGPVIPLPKSGPRTDRTE